MARAKAAPKFKTCTSMVKKVTETKVSLDVCNTANEMGTGLPCKNRENHILNMVTGFCSNRACEGTNPKNFKGDPLKTCMFYLTCPCKCHAGLDKMFNMAEKMRELVNKSDYRPAPSPFVMPEFTPHTILSNSDDIDAPTVVESRAPGYVPPTAPRTFAPTATGRAARGELESWVKDKCDEWLIEKYQFLCTPAWLADEIADEQGIKPPSVGAISAVFERWAKLGFAKIEKKPTRFVGYTEDGVVKGLDRMKADVKRNKQLARAAQHRGIR